MRSSQVALLCALFVLAPAYAKDKPTIKIQVLGSQASTYQRSIVVPGRQGTSQINCSTIGNANETSSGYGTANTTANSNTNCSMTSTADTPPRTVTREIEQENVSALLPDGRQVMLWCQQGYRQCLYLQPGQYEAEIDGNALFIIVPELSGKERKVKYKAVSVEPMKVAEN